MSISNLCAVKLLSNSLAAMQQHLKLHFYNLNNKNLFQLPARFQTSHSVVRQQIGAYFLLGLKSQIDTHPKQSCGWLDHVLSLVGTCSLSPFFRTDYIHFFSSWGKKQAETSAQCVILLLLHSTVSVTSACRQSTDVDFTHSYNTPAV